MEGLSPAPHLNDTPTAEEIVVIAGYLVMGKKSLEGYVSTELKAASQRIQGYMEAINNDRESEVPRWVIESVKNGIDIAHPPKTKIRATKEDIGF